MAAPAAGLSYRNRQRRGALGLLVALTAAALLTALLCDRFDARRRQEPPERVLYLPRGRSLNYMSLGYRGMAADATWIRSVLYVGRKIRRKDTNYEWMEKLYDVVTDLDPHWVRPYYVGGTLLSALPQDDQRAFKLLRKGLRNNPWNPRIPFQAAQLHLTRGNRREALSYLKLIDLCMGRPWEEARSRKGAWRPPPLDLEEQGILKQVPVIIEGVHREGGDYRAAVAAAVRQLSGTDDEVLRAVGGRGYREALARLLTYELSAASAWFRQVKRRPPESVDEILSLPAVGKLPAVEEHFLKRMTNTFLGDRAAARRIRDRLPRDPFGMEFYVPPDGSVHSRGLERLELHRILRTLNHYLKLFREKRGRPARSSREFLGFIKLLADSGRLMRGGRDFFKYPPRLPPHPMGPGFWTGSSEFSWRGMAERETGLLKLPPGSIRNIFSAPLWMPPGPKARARGASR